MGLDKDARFWLGIVTNFAGGLHSPTTLVYPLAPPGLHQHRLRCGVRGLQAVTQEGVLSISEPIGRVPSISELSSHHREATGYAGNDVVRVVQAQAWSRCPKVRNLYERSASTLSRVLRPYSSSAAGHRGSSIRRNLAREDRRWANKREEDVWAAPPPLDPCQLHLPFVVPF